MNVTIPACRYEPHRFQRRAHASGKRFVCMVAGTRGGKTFCAVCEFARRIGIDIARGKKRPVSGFGGKKRAASLRYWIVSPTHLLLNECWRYLYEVIPPELIDDWYESERMLWLKGNILIEGRSAENPRYLVGAGLDGLLLDEAARVKQDAWQGQLRQRLSDHQGWCIFNSTPLGQNWLYSEIFQRRLSDPENYDGFQWHTADNPVIPREEIEQARRDLPDRYFKREYEASFDAFLGTIWDEFTEKTHVVSEQQLRLEYGLGSRPLKSIFKRVIGGIDWGWSSPGCILIAGDTGREIIVLEESYASHRFVNRAHAGVTWVSEAKRMQDKWGLSESIQFMADPAKPGDIADFSQSGLFCSPAINEVTWGLRKVAEAMHVGERQKPRLRIMNTCANLIREIKGYVFGEAKVGADFTEEPAPGQSDHACDALRYLNLELTKYWTGIDEAPRQTSAYAYGPVG